MLAESVLIVIVGSSVAVAGLIAKLLYNSKCSQVTCCWGACSCIRDTGHESTVQIDTNTPTAVGMPPIQGK